MPGSDILVPETCEQNGTDASSLDNFTTDVIFANNVDDAITESEQDAEEEIDQLDSDSDVPPEQPLADIPAPKKPPQPRSGERRWGHSLLPANRVENILQAEGLMGSGVNLSKEGVYMLSVAAEEFIRCFSGLGHGHAQYHKRNMVRYDDMAAIVETRNDFGFLREIIPKPRSLHSAFTARNKRARDLLRDDPAMQFQDGREKSPKSSSPESVPASIGRTIMVVDSRSALDIVPSSETWISQPVQCLQSKPKSRKRQSMKAGAPAPTSEVSNASTENLLAHATETWEEYRERSRRLFGPGSSTSRQKQPKSSNNLSNGGPSSHSIISTQNPPETPPAFHLDDRDETSKTDPRPRVDHHISPHGGPHRPHSASLTGPGSAFLQGPGGPFPLPLPPFSPSNRFSTTDAASTSASASTSISTSTALPLGRTIYSTGSNAQENADE